MSQKDIYIEKLTQQLEYWKSEIKILELKAEVAAEDIKDQGMDKLEALKQFHDSTEGKLEEWIAASEEAWESIEDVAEQQLTTAEAAMNNALDHIKSLFSNDDVPKS
jgi:arsenate reductase-like glutaredoxin family protein